MKKLLVVVDMQNDFVCGVLGTEQARAVADRVAKRVRAAFANGESVVFTRDTHHENYLSTAEGQKLPVAHCLQKSHGWEIIDELEKVKRGLYGGATGYIDFSGDMDFCITIRTMVKRNGTVYLQAGAGIVADSVPEREYEECCHKVMALASTLIPDGVRIRNQEVCK